MYICIVCVARPGEELKVERCVKDPRSLSLPIMRSTNTHSSSAERAEHGSLGRREAADLLVGLVCLVWFSSSNSLFLLFCELYNFVFQTGQFHFLCNHVSHTQMQ